MKQNSTIAEKINKSLTYSIYDGFFYSIMVGFGESFFLVYATFLNATSIELGLIGTLPQAFGYLSQLLTNKLIIFYKSRKRMICIYVFIHAILHIPLILIFFLKKYSISTLLVLLCFYWIFSLILGPAWSSWMGDLVDENNRGNYFGKRNRVSGLAVFFSFLAAGVILQKFDLNRKTELAGFAIIFLVAFVARLMSLYFLTKKYEPKHDLIESAGFSLNHFIKQSRLTHFGLLVLFLCLMNFAVMLSGPFFTPYMLKDLKFDYLKYTIVTATALVSKNLFMPFWGKLSDRYGTKKIVGFSSLFLAILPINWLFSDNLIYLLCVQIFGGFIWAAFELSSFNIILDSTNVKNRISCVSFYNVLNGVAILGSGFIGGLLVKYNNFFWSKYLFIFLLSGILRLVVSIYFIPKLKEVREVEHITYKKLLFKIISTMTTSGFLFDLIVLKRKKSRKNNYS